MTFVNFNFGLTVPELEVFFEIFGRNMVLLIQEVWVIIAFIIKKLISLVKIRVNT